jgi:hypothetical protein
MTKRELLDKLKKEDIYPFLDAHYDRIGRNNPPDFRSYNLAELKKCLTLFGIELIREGEGCSAVNKKVE